MPPDPSIVEIQGIRADDLIREIRVAIANAGLNEPATQGELDLHGVDLELTTVAVVGTEIKPKFTVPFVGWEIGAGYSYSRTDTHLIKIALRTPWAPAPGKGTEAMKGLPDVRDALADVVHSLRSMLNTAASSTLPLGLGTAEATFKFEVDKEGSIALAVPSANRKWGSTIIATFRFGAGTATAQGGTDDQTNSQPE